MGMDIHMYVEIKNRKSGEYDFIQPTVIRRNYNNEKVECKPDFFEGRNSGLFSILRGEEDMFEPHYDVLSDMSTEVTEKYNEAFKDEYTGYFDYRWTTLAELYIATLEYPKVKNYDVEWVNDEPVYKTNPLKSILDKVIFYVEDLYGEWNWKDVMTDTRIIYWFDN